jgi:hypothetical protein
VINPADFRRLSTKDQSPRFPRVRADRRIETDPVPSFRVHGPTAPVALSAALAAAPASATSPPPADRCLRPPAQAKESEPCGSGANDGCNLLSHPTEPIEFGVPMIGTFWADEERRDTDFFRFTLQRPTAVAAWAWGQVTVQLAIVDACTVADSSSGTCTEAHACLPPGVYEVFVAPLDVMAGCGAPGSDYVVLLELDPAAGPCAPMLGDIDRSGTVDGIDLAMLLIAWGDLNPGSADITGDGLADGADLGALLDAWTG